MTLLLEHFDTLLATPNDVTLLNRAILTLAMQGKLVEQNQNDEPVTELKKRIYANKQQLLANKRISQEFAKIALDKKKIPFSLPKSWEWVAVNDVCYLERGITFPSSAKEDFPTAENIACLRTASVQDEVEWNNMLYVDRKFVPSEDKIIRQNDILISMANSYELVGKVCFVNDAPFEATFGGFISTIRCFDGVLPKYLLYVFRSAAFQNIIRGTASQTTNIANISLGKTYPLPFPLPPLSEQERIVARVEALFAQTRALSARLARAESELTHLNQSALFHLLAADSSAEFEKQWDFIATHFENLFTRPEHVAPLRQSILELAVRGKLTRRAAGDESARELLKKIRDERVESGKKEVFQPVKESEKPFVLPVGWEWARFGEIGDQRLGKMLDKGKNKGEYYPYLRNLNVQWLRIDLSDINQMRFEADQLDEYKLKQGDLLICEGGEPGRCAIWESDDLMMFQKAIHRVRPYKAIVSKYLLYHLWADAGNRQLEKYFTGATIRHFTGKALASYVCALPPVGEQARIVAKVEQLLGLCEALESRLRAAQSERGRLVESVLAGVA
jgi:type I restriction enzyme S subunit